MHRLFFGLFLCGNWLLTDGDKTAQQSSFIGVKISSRMNRGAVIPNDQIIWLPLMAITELGLFNVFEQPFQ
jgi:hypothetical protein